MLPPEWEIPLQRVAGLEVELTYNLQSHLFDVFLFAPQDYLYGQCNRSYRRIVECIPKNSCSCCPC